MAGRLNRGDVHLCRFDSPDKQRPVLVLTPESAVGHLASSTIRDVPSEVILDVDDGMKSRCAINLHNTLTGSQQCLGKRVASLSEERMRAVCVALQFALSCG